MSGNINFNPNLGMPNTGIPNNGNISLEDSNLEDHINEYVHALLAIHVVLEYEKQVGEWKDYINRVVDAEKKALENHENVLKQILNQQQQDDQISAFLGMMALSLVAGPALSWIVGTIETRLYPRFFAISQQKSADVILKSKAVRSANGLNAPIISSEAQYNQVAAKVFGEFAGNAAQKIYIEPLNFYISKAPERNADNYKSISYQQLNAVAQLPTNAKGPDLDRSLRTALEEALKDERQRGVDRIAGFGLDLRKSPDFARIFLMNMNRRDPGFKKLDIRAKKQVIDRDIEKMVDMYRQIWAKSWLYYGNNPPPTTVDEISRRIEREIWAMWILEQDFKLKVSEGRDSLDDVKVSTFVWVEGRNKTPLHPLIIDRLIELDVVLPQSFYEMYQRFLRTQKDPNGESPTVRIEGKVDEEKELENIKNWAKNRKPQVLAGNLDRIPRPVPPIARVHHTRR